MKQVFAFINYAASFILVIAIAFYQSNLFWDYANGFVNSFSVYNDFKATNNFIRFVNFTYSFVEFDVDVIYDGSRNFRELIIKSKPGSNGSNKKAIFIFLSLISLFFHLLIKKIIPQLRLSR